MNTSIRVQNNGPRTETEALWCVAVDWISCAAMDGYPTFCQYNYTTYYCFTESSSTPGTGGTTPPTGSCCGSYGSISGGNNTYPLAKEIQLIKFDTSIKLINVDTCIYTIFHTLQTAMISEFTPHLIRSTYPTPRICQLQGRCYTKPLMRI